MRMFTDFHTHVLPGIDDGSRSLKESIALLQMEAKQGITHVVATPHFYPQHDSPEHFLYRRAKAEARLREAMEDHAGCPDLIIGAEVYFFHGMSDSDVLSELTIGDNRCILIEMPSSPWSDSMYQELENIYQKRNLLPIIAHIDRYIGPFHTFGIPRRLADLPVMVQANADFFLNRFTAPMAIRMLKEDAVQLLGSDCHNLTTRKPNLQEALAVIQKRLGKEAVSRISYHCQSLLDR